MNPPGRSLPAIATRASPRLQSPPAPQAPKNSKRRGDSVSRKPEKEPMVSANEQAEPDDAELRADDVEGAESRSEEEEDDDDDSDEEGGASLEALGEGFYEVEAVRRKRVRKGQVQYFIKWRGWPESANTWEPFDNVKACADVIEEFEKSGDSVKQGRRRRGKRKFGTYILPQKKKRNFTLSTEEGSAAINVSRNEEGQGGKKSGSEPALISRGSPERMQHVSTEPLDTAKKISQDKSNFQDLDRAMPDCGPKSDVTESELGKDSGHDFLDVAVRAEVSESKELREKHSPSVGGETGSPPSFVGGELDRVYKEVARQDSTVNGHHEGSMQTETGCSEQHLSLPLEGAMLEENTHNKEADGHTSSCYTEKKTIGELGKASGTDKCAGAKKRKQGFVRRVRQSLDSQEVDTKAVVDEEKPTECGQVSEQGEVSKGLLLGTQGDKKDHLGAELSQLQVHEPTHTSPASPQSLQFVAPAVPPSHLTKIIKAVNYSNSSVNGKQDATVVFKGLRADGKEVLVDNKFMRANYPLLLIDFYEQHLRNSPSTAV